MNASTVACLRNISRNSCSTVMANSAISKYVPTTEIVYAVEINIVYTIICTKISLKWLISDMEFCSKPAVTWKSGCSDETPRTNKFKTYHVSVLTLLTVSLPNSVRIDSTDCDFYCAQYEEYWQRLLSRSIQMNSNDGEIYYILSLGTVVAVTFTTLNT